MKPDTAHWWQCDDPDCLVCESKREEMRAKAQPFLLERAATDDEHPPQATLYADGGQDDG